MTETEHLTLDQARDEVLAKATLMGCVYMFLLPPHSLRETILITAPAGCYWLADGSLTLVSSSLPIDWLEVLGRFNKGFAKRGG